jgi:hypothetical protein
MGSNRYLVVSPLYQIAAGRTGATACAPAGDVDFLHPGGPFGLSMGVMGYARATLVPAVATWLLCAGPALGADDDEKAQCISASDQGQQLRDEGKYRSAHEAFVRCSRPTCPGLVTHNCSQWLIELEAKMPTVVIDARDDKGNDLVEVKILVDGTEMATRLDGMPMPMDTGEHVFRYEAAGFGPVEERVAIQDGEKNRLVKVRLIAETPPIPVARVATAPEPAREERRTSGPPFAAWLFAGLAVAAFASEAYFGVSGLSQRSGDIDRCAPYCNPSEATSIQTKFAVADTSLGIGLVSAGLAAYFFLRSSESGSPPQTALEVSPRSGGCVGSLSGHF